MGYSNLNYLRQFPIDRLKIDKAFVQDVTYQPGSDGIASAVIAMARSLQMGVIAEGVETDLQLKLFQDLECDEMQGYYFSRPYPAEQLGALLRDYFYCGADGKRCDSRAMVSLDQDPQTLAILRRVAVHARQRLFVAKSGPEALALIADHPAAVVFWNPECCEGPNLTCRAACGNCRRRRSASPCSTRTQAPPLGGRPGSFAASRRPGQALFPAAPVGGPAGAAGGGAGSALRCRTIMTTPRPEGPCRLRLRLGAQHEPTAPHGSPWHLSQTTVGGPVLMQTLSRIGGLLACLSQPLDC